MVTRYQPSGFFESTDRHTQLSLALSAVIISATSSGYGLRCAKSVRNRIVATSSNSKVGIDRKCAARGGLGAGTEAVLEGREAPLLAHASTRGTPRPAEHILRAQPDDDLLALEALKNPLFTGPSS
jgi:hypothetical protein